MARSYGCIELGGTKILCAVARDRNDLGSPHVIETRDPADTVRAILEFFAAAGEPLAGVGIASFGPVDLDLGSPTWGHILNTPKPGWSGYDVAGELRRGLGVPVGLETDVNAAALAEAKWGAAQACRSSVYVTVGTGVGGGILVDGRLQNGLGHPEMGHFFPPRHPADLDFAGCCPFHGACLEGLASGVAISARWGKSLSQLPADHVGHEIIAWYLAHLCVTLQALVSPHRILFGGGVAQTPGLVGRIAATADRLANGYFGASDLFAGTVRASALDGRAGLYGALIIARGVVGHE